MKVTCLQMDVAFGQPEVNFQRAEQLIADAMKDSPDVLVLPETWNTGFFPQENLPTLCDRDGQQVKTRIGGLAKKYSVNIVAGSVSDLRDDQVYNTAYVFDREGNCITSYDKIHLFSPMGENQFYTPGDRLCRFLLDGVQCGLIICYDIRFPELTRSLALDGLEVLFVVSQWLDARIFHLRSLATARAIENQLSLVCCNSSGHTDQIVLGGNSSIIDPLGETIALAGQSEELLTAELDLATLQSIRKNIPVFRDRRPEIYQL